jgi:hypothetical protein
MPSVRTGQGRHGPPVRTAAPWSSAEPDPVRARRAACLAAGSGPALGPGPPACGHRAGTGTGVRRDPCRRRLHAGVQVATFEIEFAAFCNCQPAVDVSIRTAAVHLTLCVPGVGPGDQVVTAPNTYVSTAFAIPTRGPPPARRPGPETGNLNPVQVPAALTGCTRTTLPSTSTARPPTGTGSERRRLASR